MSLKGFHIIFIVLAFLCTAGFYAWAMLLPEKASELGVVAIGNISGSLAIALFIYGIWFAAKKSKTILV